MLSCRSYNSSWYTRFWHSLFRLMEIYFGQNQGSFHSNLLEFSSYTRDYKTVNIFSCEVFLPWSKRHQMKNKTSYQVSKKKGLAVLHIFHTFWDLWQQIIPFLKSAISEVFKNSIICIRSPHIVQVIKQQSQNWSNEKFHVFELLIFISWKYLFSLRFENFSNIVDKWYHF